VPEAAVSSCRWCRRISRGGLPPSSWCTTFPFEIPLQLAKAPSRGSGIRPPGLYCVWRGTLSALPAWQGTLRHSAPLVPQRKPEPAPNVLARRNPGPSSRGCFLCVAETDSNSVEIDNREANYERIAEMFIQAIPASCLDRSFHMRGVWWGERSNLANCSTRQDFRPGQLLALSFRRQSKSEFTPVGASIPQSASAVSG
jgi:hypothetical protein